MERPSARVVRGGSWDYDAPDSLRASYRYGSLPTYRSNSYGVRCVRSSVTGQPVTYCENEWPIKSVEGNGFPVLREELVDFRGGVGLDSDEDIFDVFVGVHFVQAAR